MTRNERIAKGVYLLICAASYYSPRISELEMPDSDDVNAWLDDCYTVLDCNDIEIVNTHFPNLVLIIDGCGALDPCLDVNNIATVLYSTYGGPYIYGDAILARREGPEIVPLRVEDIQFIERHWEVLWND